MGNPKVNPFNLPNVLTVLRIGMTFLFIYFLLQGNKSDNIAAGLIFILAALTDWLDGFWARRYDLISDFGKLMDPIADKFLTLAAFFVFGILGAIPMWMAVVIAVREVGLTLLRFRALNKGKVLAAEKLGKYKTVLQMGTIIVILLHIAVYTHCEASPDVWKQGISLLMYLTVGITVLSGYTNLTNNREAYFG